MDASVFQYVASGLNVGFLIVMYLYVQKREDRIREEMNAMKEDIDEVQTNYNSKFKDVHDTIHKTEMRIMESIHSLETSLRESNHTLAENVTKSLAKLEIMLMKRDAA